MRTGYKKLHKKGKEEATMKKLLKAEMWLGTKCVLSILTGLEKGIENITENLNKEIKNIINQ